MLINWVVILPFAYFRNENKIIAGNYQRYVSVESMGHALDKLHIIKLSMFTYNQNM